MKEFTHIPVMLNEAIACLNIKPEGIYVDCTLGGAGHSQEIQKKLKSGHLYAFDQDIAAIKASQVRLQTIGNNFTLIHANFVNLKKNLAQLQVNEVDGILFDLGVSSYQFDTPERGFSYQYDHYLDMRMNQEQALDAYQVVNNYSENALQKIFTNTAKKALLLKSPDNCKSREQKPIETTFELVEIIKKALPALGVAQTSTPRKKKSFKPFGLKLIKNWPF